MLSKSDILNIDYREIIGFDGIKHFEVKGVTTDSRITKPKELFVALKGDRFDGHDFISKAIEIGVSAIVVEYKWAKSNPEMLASVNIPKVIVDNTVIALGQLAKIIRQKHHIPFIAIGGSNGKTTTKEMISAVLSTKYKVLSTKGNLNNHIGVPQTLFCLKKSHEIGVIEIGTNHPGEIKYLCSILQPTHGLITNIGREHLEFFHSVKGVAEAEGELFDWLIERNGTLFVNEDDKYIKRLSKNAKRKISYGFSTGNVLVKGKLLSINEKGQANLRLRLRKRKALDVVVGVPGTHNAHNALAAAAVGFALKIPFKNIKEAISSFKAPSNRMQIKKIAGITILDDTYNANPDSVIAALSTLKSMHSSGRKIAVLSDMLELGEKQSEMHQLIGKSINKYKVNVLLTYGNLAKAIYDFSNLEDKKHFESKENLIEDLNALLHKDDVVLIKGSHAMKMDEIVNKIIEKYSSEMKE